MKSHFEQMGGTYRKVGDYYIPNLALPTTSTYELGKYGRMRRSYLENHHPARYTNLVLSGKLFDDLQTVDKQCNERMENLCSTMKMQEGVTEALKASDQMEWVRRMNNIHNRAEEIILRELVYTYDSQDNASNEFSQRAISNKQNQQATRKEDHYEI